MRFLLCLARAVAKNGFKILADAVPFGGALYDVAVDAWQEHRQGEAGKHVARAEAALTSELQELAQAPAEQVRRAAAAAVQQAADDEPQELQLALTSYLTQVPAMVRRVSRRPSDPTGTTVPPALAPRGPEDLLSFLPPKPPRFKAGDRPLLGVDWELEEMLGVGGFGEVWKARHADYKGLVAALKFCLDNRAAAALRNEADKLNRVMQHGRHAGIVPLRQVYLKADPPCLEYEFVEGGDLSGLIQELHGRSEATPDAVACWVLDLASTVRFAHRLNPPLVHRDLKPANILVQRSAEGQLSLRITDFGISGLAAAQALEAADQLPTGRSNSLAGVVRGTYTPLYASPQQMRGEPADPRDDVHALGIIWYQMLCGDLSQGLPADWRDELSDHKVPGDMIDVVGRCVAGRAKRRLADASELVERLNELLKSKEPSDNEEEVDVTMPVQRAPQGIRQTHAIAKQPSEQQHVHAAASPTEELLQLLPPGRNLSRLLETLPVGQPQKFINSLGMEFVLIPAGTFPMGSPLNEAQRQDNEGAQHYVEISRPFYMSVYPVTQEEYQRLMGNNPSYFQASSGGAQKVTRLDTRHGHPVENVSWDDAVIFCLKLSEQTEEKKKGGMYRLPTEAEWEYACRGGANSSTPFYCGATLSSTQANFDGNYPYYAHYALKGPYLERTTPVGSYEANAFSLFDMHGNVWEWCADWFDENYYNQSPRQDPQGPQNGTLRVRRGGSWDVCGRECRSAYRCGDAPGRRHFNLGFRLVCVAPRIP